MRLAAFDIGTKNFAYYVEDCSLDELLDIRKEYYSLPKKSQRRVKGKMNPQIRSILDRVCLNGKRVTSDVETGLDVVNLRYDDDAKELDLQTRLNLFDFLSSKRDLWDTCDIIIIEQQYFKTMGFKNNRSGGTSANVTAIKFGEICLAWFLDRYRLFKEIIVFGSAFKTQTLGAPNDLTKAQRKKWAIEKGTQIMESRGDEEAISIASTKKTCKGRKQKMDDMYDCVVMMQAFKFLRLVLRD